MATRPTFKGTDRRILVKMKKCFTLAAKRDLKANTARRTSAISSRVNFFPASDTTLTAAVLAVKTKIDALLAMTTTI